MNTNPSVTRILILDSSRDNIRLFSFARTNLIPVFPIVIHVRIHAGSRGTMCRVTSHEYPCRDKKHHDRQNHMHRSKNHEVENSHDRKSQPHDGDEGYGNKDCRKECPRQSRKEGLMKPEQSLTQPCFGLISR